MANEKMRIIQLPTAPQVEDNDYLAIDNTSTPTAENEGGTRKILVKDITAKSADAVEYDNTTSGLEADNVQDAIDEISNFSAEDVPYDNSDSGLESEDVQSAIDEIADVLGALKVEGTIENQSIATFTDGSALPMPKLEVAVEPQQDLHGYDAPWVGGAGKNKLPLTVENIKAVNTSGTWNGDAYTLNNIVFTIQKDSNNNVTGININGTASAQTQFTLITKNRSAFLVSGTSYIMTGCPSNGSDNTYRLLLSDDLVDTYRDYGSGVTFTPADALLANNYSARFVISSGQAFTNYTFKPMIRLSSVTDATFAPYSNECPISGWTEEVITRTGKNQAKKTIHGYINYQNSKMVIDNDSESVVFYAVAGKTYTVSSSVTMNRSMLGLADTDNIINLYQLLDIIELSNEVVTWTATWTGWTVWYKCTSAQSSFANSVQVELGSSASDFEPYNGTTTTIPFVDGQGNPLTVYGGSLDVVSGVLTLTHGYIASYNGETLPSTWISDRDVYAEGTTPTIGAEVCYELATPTTIQLTPTQVNSLMGVNNIWADCGKINKAVYIRDLNIVINNLLNLING